jgi:TRAP-type C4-dicarboxylate transport system substrate-binding protein
VRRLVFAIACALGVLVAARYATAERPTVKLRFAAVAPDGTAWARSFRAFASDIEQATAGAVQIKWYLGGIAGDELESMERVRRGQLDGLAGALLCERLAPSLKVVRVPGIVRTRAEYRQVVARLHGTIAAEMEREGWVALGVSMLGEDHLFTRRPFRSLEDLRGMRLWLWNLDEPLLAFLKEIGVESAPMPPSEAARAFDDGRLDGFVAVPSAALAYQWTIRAPLRRAAARVGAGVHRDVAAVVRRARARAPRRGARGGGEARRRHRRGGGADGRAAPRGSVDAARDERDSRRR